MKTQDAASTQSPRSSPTAESGAARRLDGLRARARDPHLYVALLGLALLGALAVPATRPAIPFPDTLSFLNWPAPMVAHGVQLMGARAAGYPLLLRTLGVGPALVHFQWVLSLVCWGYLGWKFARGPGAIIGGLFSLAPAVACWSFASLAESVSISLSAFVLACSLELGRELRAGRVAIFVVGVLAFAMVRDANLLVIPFLCLPLLAQLVQRSRRALVVLGLVFAILAGSAWDISRNDRGSLYTYLSVFWRVGSDKETKAWFIARGMPKERMDTSDAKSLDDFYSWLNDGGTWTYRAWALMRPAYYADTWRLLAQPDGSLALPDEFFPKVEISRSPRLASFGDALYRASAPPRALWLAILLVPAFDAWRNRRIGVPSALAAALVVATYVQGFVSYVSDFSQIQRHMLGAYILYRFAFVIGLCAAVDVFRGRAPRGAIWSWTGDGSPSISARSESAEAAASLPSPDTD